MKLRSGLFSISHSLCAAVVSRCDTRQAGVRAEKIWGKDDKLPFSEIIFSVTDAIDGGLIVAGSDREED